LIDALTRIYGLIGRPLEHSISPQIQNAAYAEMGLNAVYVCFHTRGSPQSAVRAARDLGVRGLNVTVPFKLDVVKAVDRVEGIAEKLGAVNVISLGKEIVGYNTDASAAVRSLREAVEGSLCGLEVTIIGAGGSARAIAFGLAEEGCALNICNRTVPRAVALCREVSRKTGARCRSGGLDRQTLKEAIDRSQLLVNATPVGMYPKTSSTPVDPDLLRSDLTVMDIVYNPQRTLLLRQAKERGCKTVGGLSMLVYQAAESIRIWTGMEPPVEAMFRAASSALRRYTKSTHSTAAPES